MSDAAELKRLIRNIVNADANYPVRGEVTAITGQTCTVKLETGLEVTGVRLKATIGEGNDYMLVTPKTGNDVLMLSDDGTLDNLTVIKADRFEKIELYQGGLKVLLDSNDGKVQVKNDSVSLLDLFTIIADFLKQLKVYTSQGPSGTPLPDTIAAIEQWELKVKQLLK